MIKVGNAHERLLAVHDWLKSRRSWQRLSIAALAGGVSALAMAPYNAFPLLFLTLPVILWLLDGLGEFTLAPRPIAAVALLGWAFGFGYFLAGLYWVGFAFLVEADSFAWLIPIVALLLPGGLALFSAGALILVQWLSAPASLERVLIFPLAWTATEWLRGHIFTGLPWNLMGYAIAGNESLIQWAAWVGSYGMTLLVVLCAGSAALIVTKSRNRTTRALMASSGILVLALMWGAGAWRLSNAESANVPGVRLRIVQPNIDQKEKWQPENRANIFARYLEMSRQPATKELPKELETSNGITHILWPESATPFFLAETPQALAALDQVLSDKTYLLTGAARRDNRGRYFNSVLVLNASADIVDVYDKMHLVPFGEYLPMQPLLSLIGLRQLVRSRGGFTSGDRAVLLRVPGLPPMRPLICYEIIFPGAVTSPGPRPGWLLNVTNDAWFGDTTGPRQHLQIAITRAVEEGLPVARAANTGISALIDPYGRLLGSLPLNTAGVLDVPLPLAAPPTPYARFGDRLLLGLMIALGVAAIISRRHRLAKTA